MNGHFCLRFCWSKLLSRQLPVLQDFQAETIMSIKNQWAGSSKSPNTFTVNHVMFLIDNPQAGVNCGGPPDQSRLQPGWPSWKIHTCLPGPWEPLLPRLFMFAITHWAIMRYTSQSASLSWVKVWPSCVYPRSTASHVQTAPVNIFQHTFCTRSMVLMAMNVAGKASKCQIFGKC